MNDPHVAKLIYRVEHSDGFSYERAEPLDHTERGLFRVRIEDRRANVEMIEHFATAEDAQAIVHPILKTWEVDAGLTFGPGVLRFIYERAEFEDRKPTPGVTTLIASGAAFSVSGGSIKAQSVLRAYPKLPAGLDAPPYVAAMYDSFSRYHAEQRGLGVAAYICLTLLQESTGVESGKRQAAADTYKVERCVLNTLGTLADEKGGPLDARKAKGLDKPYTIRERAWIEAAIKALIRRAAEVAYDAAIAREMITMKDFPQL